MSHTSLERDDLPATVDPFGRSTASFMHGWPISAWVLSRFSDEAWQRWPFRGLREGFKATEDRWREASQVEGMSPHHRHIDDDQVKSLRESMARTGYVSGRAMAGTFQFLNSRDLVWSRNTRRYLLGQDEAGNDMMSWNADVTRLPERMHAEYLSSLFLNNALASGQYRVAGESVALMDIGAPLLVVGTARDHVSPWRSVYKIHLQTDVQTAFVLVAGGHNASIVSEPGHPRRSYQMATAEVGHGWIDPDAWVARSPLHEGSWWPAMSHWLKARSSAPQSPPALKRSQVLGDAPGTYVKVRYAD